MGAAQTEEQWLWLERSVVLAAEWMARTNGDIARADELATRVVTLGVAILDLHAREKQRAKAA